jgi:hypothetical protein
MFGMLKKSVRFDDRWLAFVKAPDGVWLLLDAHFATEQDGYDWLIYRGFNRNVLIKR